MKFKFHKVLLKKKFPLAISRGIRGDAYNLFLSYEKDGIIGWGEAAPGKNENAESFEEVESQLNILIAEGIVNKSAEEVNKIAKDKGIAPCATAALDMAIWDWKAKNKVLPLHQFLHFPAPSVPTSVTLGINPPEVVKERIPLMLEGTTIKALKVKLGAPQGIEAYQEIFSQVL